MRSEKKLNICIHGSTGKNNIASEAKLLGTIKDLKELLGEELQTITVLTENITNQKRFINDEKIKFVRLNPAAFADPRIWLASIDLLVITSDTSLEDRLSTVDMWIFYSLVRAAKAMGKGVVLYSIHSGRLQPFNQKLLKAAMNHVDLTMLNSPESLIRLKKYGIKNEAFCTASCSYLLDKPTEQQTINSVKKHSLNPYKRSVISIFPREYFSKPATSLSVQSTIKKLSPSKYLDSKFNEDQNSSRYKRQIADYCDWLIEQFDANILLIATAEHDEIMVRSIYEKIKSRYRVRQILPSSHNLQEYLSLLSVSSFQVGSQMASIQLGSIVSLPAIGLGGDRRMEYLFREMGMINYFSEYASYPYSLPHIYDLDELLKSYSLKMFRNKDSIADSMSKVHLTFENRAMQNRKYLLSWMQRNLNYSSQPARLQTV